MIIQSPNPIAITILDFPIYWYGLIMASAVLAGICISDYLGKKVLPSLPKDFFMESSPFLIIVGILGARLYYCLLNWSYYSKHLIDIFNIRQGGLSIHGMIIAGIAAVWIIARKHNLSFLKLLDILSCSAIFAQSVGRWGNFFNSEAFGLQTNGKWGLAIPQALRPEGFENFNLFHPTFLYESILDLFGFFILVLILKKSSKSGYAFFSYLIGYGIIRIIVESVRIDSVCSFMGYPVAQVFSAFIIFVGLIGLLVLKINKH